MAYQMPFRHDFFDDFFDARASTTRSTSSYVDLLSKAHRAIDRLTAHLRLKKTLPRHTGGPSHALDRDDLNMSTSGVYICLFSSDLPNNDPSLVWCAFDAFSRLYAFQVPRCGSKNPFDGFELGPTWPTSTTASVRVPVFRT